MSKGTYKRFLPIIILILFYLLVSKMFVIIAYDKDYLRDPKQVKKLIKIQDSYKKIPNNVTKPQGKRIFTPLLVRFLRKFYGKDVSFVKGFKKTDRWFMFFTFIGFHLLLIRLGYDIKTTLLGSCVLSLYLMYGFVKIFPVWRFSDIPNLMFLVWGLFFIVSNFRVAFLINLLFMTLNRETGILLVLILIIKFLLDNEERIKKLNFKGMKSDFLYILTAAFIYFLEQILLEKVICKNPLPWGGEGIHWALLFYSKMNFTMTGIKYFFNWFNMLIILSVLNFWKKSNLVKSSVFIIFLYILSVYLVGGVFGEGEGLLLPVAPILTLASIEELKILKII